MPDSIDELAKRRRAESVNRVAMEMKRYHRGDLEKVQHFVRVYTLAKSIGELEKLTEEEQLDLELAALTHSVEGDKVKEVKAILLAAEKIPELRSRLNDAIAMRVCHMVENAHNYEHIATLDHQILLEAMMIVEFKEKNTPEDEIVRFAEERFITNTGKLFLSRAFKL